MADSVVDVIDSAVGDGIKVEELLNSVDYSIDPKYVPSNFALEFVTFIKLVNGEEGEENKTPLMHYHMLDTLTHRGARIANLCHRGSAKTTVCAEYLFLYIGTYGMIPGFGPISLALYVSDSIENGVKNMRKNLEFRWENSDFLKYYVPDTKFTDIRWEFRNLEGNRFIVKGYGAKALTLDSRLYTANGYTTIGACQIGDQIYGADGKLTTITAKSEVFHKPMYRITLDDGRSIKVSEDHINPVIVNTNPNNIARWEEFNLTTKELLELPLVHTKKGNRNHRGTSSKHLMYVKNAAALEYPERALPVDPYTLGVVLGDGRIQRPSCSVELTTHIDDLATYHQEIPYIFGKGRLDKRNPNTWTQSIRGLGQTLKAMKLGVHGKDKFIPEEYFLGSIEQRLALLQGLMDTDGTVDKNGRTVFCSVSPRLLADTGRLARSLGATVRCSKKPFCCEIWLNEPLFRLPRKLDRQRFDRKADRVAITSITRIENEPSQCIAVDNKEHQFLTGEYFRTHNTGVRGAKELGVRPQLAVLDDLISDEDARSATVIAAVEDTVYKAVEYALHPKKNMVVWSGTPFNAKDPLYKAVESGAWAVNVFPVCEQFPCPRKDFRGSWPDRFSYDYVNQQYQKALKLGKIDTFNQELMLRIMSDEDRLIADGDIRWYSHQSVLRNLHHFNIAITTDFATSTRDAADYSVLSVWAYNSNGDWFWIDGVCKRQLMNKNIDDLFRLAQKYRPQVVGIEVTGQQGGFISWIQDEMITRNVWFQLASEGNDSRPGIRPNTNKMVRFQTVVPWFKAGKMYFPHEMKDSEAIKEAVNELSLASPSGFRSKHDDFIDTISMLPALRLWKPSEDATMQTNDNNVWDLDIIEDDVVGSIGSYLV